MIAINRQWSNKYYKWFKNRRLFHSLGRCEYFQFSDPEYNGVKKGTSIGKLPRVRTSLPRAVADLAEILHAAFCLRALSSTMPSDFGLVAPCQVA